MASWGDNIGNLFGITFGIFIALCLLSFFAAGWRPGKQYGGRKNRGMKPEIFVRASGKIIRTMLQQAEKTGLLKKVLQGKRFGRSLTEQGKSLLEGIK